MAINKKEEAMGLLRQAAVAMNYVQAAVFISHELDRRQERIAELERQIELLHRFLDQAVEVLEQAKRLIMAGYPPKEE